MRPCEADWICARLIALGPEKASPLVNIGSSTLEFRTKKKPHIESRLFAPLREAGFEITHVDIREDPGVDLTGDLTQAQFLSTVKGHGFRSAICSNLLEHLTDRTLLVQACTDIVGPFGILVVTVPYSYPYHPDPIDTMYRPSPAALAESLSELNLTEAAILSDGTMMSEEFSGGWRKSMMQFAKIALRIANIARPRIAFAQAHRLFWILRNYKVTCAVFSAQEPLGNPGLD